MSDYGTVTDALIRFERILPGPIDRVWAYLTESDKRGTWLSSGPMDLRVGGRVEHVFRNWELTDDDDPPPAKYEEHAGEVRYEGRIVACDPPNRLVYTWSSGTGEDSEVSFELSAEGDSVRLVLTHRRIAMGEEIKSAGAGWHTHLDILHARLSGRVPDGFWRSHTRLEAEYAERIAAPGDS